jgi:protein-disulfide isomerase
MHRLYRPFALFALTLSLMGGAAHAQAVVPDDMTLGDPKAKVTVVEYASTACSHCAAWNQEVWPAFKARYVDTGKVFYVYREFITEPPELAIAGPLLARCAGRPKYFAVIDAVFRAQSEIYAKKNIAAPFEKIAARFGMNKAKMTACLTDKAAVAAIQKRVQTYAERDGVDSTPTFVVSGPKVAGVMLAGEQPLEALEAAYDIQIN